MCLSRTWNGIPSDVNTELAIGKIDWVESVEAVESVDDE
jgi:hypothetical protein